MDNMIHISCGGVVELSYFVSFILLWNPDTMMRSNIELVVFIRLQNKVLSLFQFS